MVVKGARQSCGLVMVLLQVDALVVVVIGVGVARDRGASQCLFVCHVWMVACRDWTQTAIARNISHVARLVSSTSKASEGPSDPSMIAKNASTRRDRPWLDCFLRKKKRAVYA